MAQAHTTSDMHVSGVLHNAWRTPDVPLSASDSFVDRRMCVCFCVMYHVGQGSRVCSVYGLKLYQAKFAEHGRNV